MIALSTLLPRIITDLPGITTPMAQRGLQIIAREFCQRTGVWHEKLTAFPSVKDQKKYTLTSEYATALIHRVEEVVVEPDTDDEYQIYSDSYSVDLRESQLILDPAIARDGDSIQPRVVYLPLFSNTELPDFVMNMYEQYIIYGVLAMYQKDLEQTWGNREEARANALKYKDGIDEVLADEIFAGEIGDIVAQVDHVL